MPFLFCVCLVFVLWCVVWRKSFILFCLFEAESHYVALAGLELIVKARLASNSEVYLPLLFKY